MSSETPGVLIGLSNVLTSKNERAQRGPEPEAKIRDILKTYARRALEGRESFIHDVVLAGRRVRLFSNSHHLGDFFRDNFPSVVDWKAAAGKDAPLDPALTVWAMTGVDALPSGSCHSGNEAFLFNTSWYGDLRALTMEGLARLLALEGHVLHAGAVEVDGKGLVWRYPKEIIHPTPTWGLLEIPGSKLIADGWVVADADGRIHALEKQLYVRTSLVGSYPALLPKILRAKFENVPAEAAPAEAVLEEARRHDSARALAGLPPERALDIAGRLIASPDARMLIDPAVLVGRSRVASTTRATTAYALKAAAGRPLEVAPVEPFPCPGYVVNVQAVEGHPRELARLLARPA